MKCHFCGKQRLVGHRVSHSNIRTKTTQRPNIQRVHVVLKGRVRRVWACTRCIRSGKVVKAA